MMAMSGVDGKSFTIDNTHNLLGRPIGCIYED